MSEPTATPVEPSAPAVATAEHGAAEPEAVDQTQPKAADVQVGHERRRPYRPGDVVATWRLALAIGWATIVTALLITAGAAEVIHRSVWWLGSPGDRALLVLAVVPMLLPIATITMAIRDMRWVCEVSALASLSTLLVAFGDRTNSPSAAVVTAALGVAGALLTVAATSGRVRAA